MTRRLLLLVDFDETLTRTGKDTISILASAAYARRFANVEPPPWSYFADSYLHDYNLHAQAHPPATRTTLEAETKFIKSGKSVERASIDRVEASGLFKDLDLSTFLNTAAGDRKQVEGLMRKGWWETMSKVLARGDRGKVAVVSVNWSRAWIRKCLEGSVRLRGDGIAPIQRIEIFANELVLNDDQQTTTGSLDRWFGQEDGGIWTGWDKLRVMKDIIKDNQKDFEGEGFVVYVGDSTTDLLCLLEADVGIIFDRKLDSVCKRLGLEIKEGLVIGGLGNARGGNILVRIEEWEEVEQWIDTL